MRRILFVIPLFALMALCGCKTTRSMEEQSVSIRDSIRITDSVRVRDSVRVKTSVRDSVNIRDSLVIRLDPDGNEKSRESWHSRDTYHWQSDSVMELKLMLKEAIQERDAALAVLKKHEKVVFKGPTFRDKLQYFLSGVFFMVILIIIAVVAAWKRKKV